MGCQEENGSGVNFLVGGNRVGLFSPTNTVESDQVIRDMVVTWLFVEVDQFIR